MRNILFLTVLMLLSPCRSDEVFHVLAFDVESRYVGPFYERSISKNSIKLEEVIQKLRKLTPKDGVTKVAEFEINNEGGQDQPGIVGDSKLRVGDPERLSNSYKLGYKRFFHEGDLQKRLFRSLQVSRRINDKEVEVYRFSFSHQVDNRWSISAICQTRRGSMFVFERRDGQKRLNMEKRRFMIMSLSEKKSSVGSKALSGRTFLNTGTAPVSLIRVSKSPGLFAKVETNLQAKIQFMERNQPSLVSYSGWNIGPKNNTLVAFIEFDRVASSSVSLLLQHQGSYKINCNESGKGTEEVFEGLERKVIHNKKINGYSSIGQKQKPRYVFSATLIEEGP